MINYMDSRKSSFQLVSSIFKEPAWMDFTRAVVVFPSKGGLPKTRKKRMTPTDQTSALAYKHSFILSTSPLIRSGAMKYSDEI